MRGLCTFLLLAGCESGKVVIEASSINDPIDDTSSVHGDDTAASDIDLDGDGFFDFEDCDDTDPAVYPGAEEVCNETDDDCDGEVDNLPPSGDLEDVWFSDGDGDGFGSGEATYFPCDPPPGHVRANGDCNEDDASIHPDADEVCGDGTDNNCDGLADPCRLEGIVPSNEAGATIAGWQPSEHVGNVAESAGDVNGDGLGDLLIAVPNSSEYLHESGAVYLFLSPLDGAQDIEDSDAVLLGSEVEDEAGRSIGSFADLNRDGNDEIVAGIPQEDSMGLQSGAVAVVWGTPSGPSQLMDARTLYVGEGPGNLAGMAVVDVGDSDGDGIGELAIAAPGATTEDGHVGAVYVVTPEEGTFNLIASNAKLTGSHAGEFVHIDLANAGDANGDGYADLISGTPEMEHSGMPARGGGAYISYGPFNEGTIPIIDISTTIRGITSTGFAGRSVGSLGDIDADGKTDMVLGCHNCTGTTEISGAAFVFLGGTDGTVTLEDADYTMDGEAYQDFAGYSVAGAGDVNGDGVGDLLIGAKGNDYGTHQTGATYLFYGPLTSDTTLALADLKIHGVASNDQLGTHVASAGDLDADGLSDFLTGAPLGDAAHEDVGYVSVFFGNARM